MDLYGILRRLRFVIPTFEVIMFVYVKIVVVVTRLLDTILGFS